MKKYGDEACEISSNTVSATFDIFQAIFADVYTKTKFNADAYVSDLLSSAQKDQIKARLDQVKNISDFLITKSCAYINDPILRQKVEARLKAVMKVIFEAATQKGLSNIVNNLIVDEMKEFVKDVLIEVCSKPLFEEYYIYKTKVNLTTANDNLMDGLTSSNFNFAHSNAQVNIDTTERRDSVAISKMQNYNFMAQTFNTSQTYLNAASTIAAFTGFGIAWAGVLKSLGTASQIMKYVYQAKSIATGAFRLRSLTFENNNAASETYIPLLNTIPDNNYEPISLVALNSIITEYNLQLQTTLNFVQSNSRNEAFNSMLQLYPLDSILNKEYYISSSGMLASASQYHINTGNGDYLTHNIIIGGIEGNQSKRNGLYDFFSAYVIDSTDLSLVDSIVHYGNEVITNSLDLYDSLNFYNLELENIAIEPYLIDLGIISQNHFSQGETKSIKAVVKNIGQTDINNVYGKFFIGGGFNVIQDSIYLGTISANQIDTFEYQISAPNNDTIVHFTIDVKSSNGIVEGIGGALVVAGNGSQNSLNIINANFSVKLWPNPAKNQLNISTNYSDYRIDILNLEGRIIKSINSKDSSLTIDVEGFENGIYLIKGSKKGSTIFQEKFIKL
jgi:hypothetical protein